VRKGKKVRQQVIATLGRLDLLEASGQLERLMRSGLRHCLRLRSKIEGRMKRFSAGSVMETRVVPHLR
jgi:hypothetical protein